MKIRYTAVWLADLGPQIDGQDFEPDLCIYERKSFGSEAEARAWALAHDLYVEGSVEIDELRDDEGLPYYWSTIERFPAYE